MNTKVQGENTNASNAGPLGTAALPGQWQLIEKDRLIPRDDNPRKISEKAKSFLELVESVRSAGIVTPLLGRPHPQLPGKIELLAVAGLDHFPVVVRPMDDRTALKTKEGSEQA